MADNVNITAGSGTVIATDDIGGGVQVQREKVTWGPDGTANDTDDATGKRLPVKAYDRYIRATGSTVTRPANTTAYTANDLIGSQTTSPDAETGASFTMSDINDDLFTIERMKFTTTDTGLQGKRVRAWLFHAAPVVHSLDNAALSLNHAGFLGTMSGTLRTFFDGASGILVPDEGGRMVATPLTGAKTVIAVYQTLDDFTPSANSTTIVGVLEGFQGRA